MAVADHQWAAHGALIASARGHTRVEPASEGNRSGSSRPDRLMATEPINFKDLLEEAPPGAWLTVDAPPDTIRRPR